MGTDKVVGGFGIITAVAFVFALLTVFIVFNIAKTGVKLSNTYLCLPGGGQLFCIFRYVGIDGFES